jgi:sortase A
MTSNQKKLLGNALILVSLGVFGTFSFAIMRAYFFPPQVILAAEPSDTFQITIPKIQAQARVVEQVDPWNEAIYDEALKHGVAQAAGFALPGETGTVFLFAHSSAPPWEQIYNNTIFLRLGDLQAGDEVFLDRNKKRYRYVVTDKKEVWPHEVSYLDTKKQHQLILQTCTPIGTSLKRLLIFAEEKE